MSSTEIDVLHGGIAVGEAARITATGLVLPEDVTADDWRSIGESANLVSSVGMWAMGDWGLYGRDHFPDSYVSAFTAYDEKTVRVAISVCEAFPDHDFRARFIRQDVDRRALSFQHFSAVANRPQAEREYWLERACTEANGTNGRPGLSVHQLRAAMKQSPLAAVGANEVPEERPAVQSEFGYIYELGPHRLLCGDATIPEHIAALLGDEKAAMIWTDPPYGVDYVGGSNYEERGYTGARAYDRKEISNDTPENLRAMLVGAWRAVSACVVDSAPWYVAGPTGDCSEDFIASFREAGWRYKQLLVWAKNRLVLGRQDYHLRHEGVYYGATAGETTMGRMTGTRLNWYGDDSQVSVFEVPSPSQSLDHPTMKPVELIVPMLLNSSRPGEIVLDPFAGSGSTMVAAELTGRRAFLVELEPAYADVIRARYEALVARRAEGADSQAT